MIHSCQPFLATQQRTHGKSPYSTPQAEPKTAATGRCGSSKDFWFGTFKSFLFPTCQVRVVRFYVSHPGRFLLFFLCFFRGDFFGHLLFFFGGFFFAQLMVWGWWFGARWFGFRLDPRKWKGLFLKGTPIRIPNHRDLKHQFTISWLDLLLWCLEQIPKIFPNWCWV